MLRKPYVQVQEVLTLRAKAQKDDSRKHEESQVEVAATPAVGSAAQENAVDTTEAKAKPVTKNVHQRNDGCIE
jgi:hypothetical protein